MEPPYQDLEHLRLLSIFHYVVGAITGLFACLPVFHLAIGLVMLIQPEMLGDPNMPDEFPAVMGGVLVGMAGLMIVLGWTAAIGMVLAGRYLGQRRRWNFCMVVAAVACVFFPFGTVLGVLTIIVLMRPSVRAMFT